MGVSTTGGGGARGGDHRGDGTFAVVVAGECGIHDGGVASQVAGGGGGSQDGSLGVLGPGIGDGDGVSGVAAGVGIVSRPALGVSTTGVGGARGGDHRGDGTFAVVVAGECGIHDGGVASQVAGGGGGSQDGSLGVLGPGIGDGDGVSGVAAGVGIVSRPALGVSTTGVGGARGGDHRGDGTFAVVVAGE